MDAYNESDVDDRTLVEALERAVTSYGLCPNRVWAAASSHPEKELIIPDLFPAEDNNLQLMFGQKDVRPSETRGHGGCTVDFCEKTQENYTSVTQRHESPSCRVMPCGRIEGFFPRNELNEAGRNDKPTAWRLNGRRTVQPGQRFMAVSHVWSDGTGAGTWPAGEVNKCLYHFFRKAAGMFRCEGLWWDTICVPSEKFAKAKAIANMHMNYREADVTLVHDCFLRDVTFVDAETACIAVIMSPWFSRGWTALELANSRTVKIVFKTAQDDDENGGTSPLILDLDEDLLKNPKTKRHWIVAGMIDSLRQNTITDMDQLLRVLRPRYTSWARDMTIISALLVGAPTTTSQHSTNEEHGQDVYEEHVRQNILRSLENMNHGNLFHNLPTANRTSWCPARLLSLPLSGLASSLQIDADGNAIGLWKVLPVRYFARDAYTWRDAHPLVAATLRLSLKQEEQHRCLVEPIDSVNRFLLVKVVSESFEVGVYQLVGALLLYQHQEVEPQISEQMAVLINAPWKAKDTARRLDHSHPAQSRNLSKKAMRDEPLSSPKRTLTAANQRMRFWDPYALAAQDTYKDLSLSCYAVERLAEREDSPRGENIPLESIIWNVDPSYVYIPESFWSCEGQNMDLLQAVKAGDLDTVSQLLIDGADIASRDVDGRTPISWAAGLGRTFILARMLGHHSYYWYSETVARTEPDHSVVDHASNMLRVHCNSMDDEGQSPLFWAVKSGHLATAELLLQYHETDIQAADQQGDTPLQGAVDRDMFRMLKLLLDYGADEFSGRRLRVEHNSLLEEAALNVSPATFQLLLDRDTDVVHRERALNEATRGGNTPVLDLLLKAGVDPDAFDHGDSRTPLMRAISRNDEVAVKALLRTGRVDVNIQPTVRNSYGEAASSRKTPLILAVEAKGSIEWECQPIGEKGDLPPPRGYARIVKMLLDTGKVDPNLRYADEKTALHTAAEYGDLAIVKIMLDAANIDIDAKDSIGATPLYRAAEGGFTEIVDLLLQTGKVDVDAKVTWYEKWHKYEKQQKHVSTAEQVAKRYKHHGVLEVIQAHAKRTNKSRSGGLLRLLR